MKMKGRYMKALMGKMLREVEEEESKWKQDWNEMRMWQRSIKSNIH